MIDILSEYGPTCLVIVVSILVMCSVREMLSAPVPGDQEKRALLRHLRKISARSQQQKRALLDDVAGRAEMGSRLNLHGIHKTRTMTIREVKKDIYRTCVPIERKG